MKERITADGRHAVGNGDGGQAAAITERPPTDGRHDVCFSTERPAIL